MTLATPVPDRLAASRSGAPRPPRRRPSPGWTLSWSPTAVLAFLAMVGLVFVTVLGSKGALLFLACGLTLVLTSPGTTLAGLRENWLVVAMTLWCLVSFTWSDYPALSLRYGVQLCLTVMIAIAIFTRLTPMAFVKVVFVAYALAGIGSLLSGRSRGDGMGFLGLYASKNALAAAASLLIIASVAVLIDRRLSPRWRVPAILMMLLGGLLLVLGKSTGALAAVAGVVVAFLLLQFLQRLPPLTRLICIVLGFLLLVLGGVVIAGMADQLAATVLQTTGKDVTLTGRTDLWGFALREIAARPLLGAGYQAVWVQGNPLAEELWAMFGIESRSGFHFHNTLLSNAVEIGIIGAALQAMVFFGGLGASLVWAIRSPSAPSVFLALFMVRQLLSMGVEVVFFFQFDPVTILTLAAVHYGRGFRRTARAFDTGRSTASPAVRLRQSGAGQARPRPRGPSRQI